MKVILLESIRNLGALGEEVNVSNGFARNYLIPQDKAVRATDDNRAYFQSRRAELEKAAAMQMEAAEARVQQLSQLEQITIYGRATDEETLYGSIDTRQIADAITAAGVEVQRSEVRLDHGAIRQLGEHQIGVQVSGDLTATITLVVVPEQ